MQSIFIIEDYEALGTVWYIECFDVLSDAKKQNIRDKVIQEIETFQKKYSRFDQDSLLNSLNKNKKVLFDKCLYEMLSHAEDWRVITNGVFDVGIKAKLENIGYGAQQSVDITIGMQAENSQMSRVILEEGLILWNSDLEIDLGGIGKGYLIDKLAKTMRDECGLKYFLINGGGDIFVTSDNGKVVELLLEHPTDLGKYIGKVYLQDESLCVSSSFKRSWKQGYTKRNHFIDTKEGKLIESASFVIAKSATQADVLATVLVLTADSESQLSSTKKAKQVEYMTISQRGDVYYTERFKQALNTL